MLFFRFRQIKKDENVAGHSSKPDEKSLVD